MNITCILSKNIIQLIIIYFKKIKLITIFNIVYSLHITICEYVFVLVYLVFLYKIFNINFNTILSFNIINNIINIINNS